MTLARSKHRRRRTCLCGHSVGAHRWYLKRGPYNCTALECKCADYFDPTPSPVVSGFDILIVVALALALLAGLWLLEHAEIRFPTPEERYPGGSQAPPRGGDHGVDEH